MSPLRYFVRAQAVTIWQRQAMRWNQSRTIHGSGVSMCDWYRAFPPGLCHLEIKAGARRRDRPFGRALPGTQAAACMTERKACLSAVRASDGQDLMHRDAWGVEHVELSLSSTVASGGGAVGPAGLRTGAVHLRGHAPPESLTGEYLARMAGA
ncbi:protein of unknown function [Burkholderia multivorans]